ncbi:MAG: ATP-binding protein, partial [Pseudonocardiaceae bacterium]
MRSVVSLHIRMREHRCATLVQPIGVLDISTYAQLRDALLKAVTDEPSAVIVDLDELTVPSTYSLTVFSTVWMRVVEWPGVPLLLVAEEPVRRAELMGSPICHFVPVHPDLEAAMSAVGYPPQRRRDRLTLPGIAVSSGLARQFVRQLCYRWDIASMADAAAAVATELVENVVQHTASAAELRLELRQDMLSVAVSD